MRSSRSARTKALGRHPFAHRGLHGEGRIENSRAAFLAAIAAGHGIELDVQLSGDDAAMVFHDARLDRLTDDKGALLDRDAATLAAVRIKGTDEGIPTLAEILALIGGQVPVLIEIKAPRRTIGPLCRAVAGALDTYPGKAGIMSFNPGVARWFARERPETLRGLVVTEEHKQGLRGRIERTLSLAWAKPDFLAYDIRDLPSRFAAAARRCGLPVFTWTVRSPAALEIAAAHADQIIYELPVRP
ncbi:glycerophosphodiester phosphodiesterase [Allosphingosinicella flava]|uniref:Glycerophosphodiester phosphodiesterase n=1 Tax=Allosphingosinicella flava TaxID=2771430 RepID=A0A7T2LM10_9SPHN|nr:glycerophosphodiester phosphodiesterase family protein [Sphingosinicella flava]QPQ54592.1 glycerophosphodiester phosphodiesterase [Sphingosinicella flava]